MTKTSRSGSRGTSNSRGSTPAHLTRSSCGEGTHHEESRRHRRRRLHRIASLRPSARRGHVGRRCGRFVARHAREHGARAPSQELHVREDGLHAPSRTAGDVRRLRCDRPSRRAEDPALRRNANDARGERGRRQRGRPRCPVSGRGPDRRVHLRRLRQRDSAVRGGRQPRARAADHPPVGVRGVEAVRRARLPGARRGARPEGLAAAPLRLLRPAQPPELVGRSPVGVRRDPARRRRDGDSRRRHADPHVHVHRRHRRGLLSHADDARGTWRGAQHRRRAPDAHHRPRRGRAARARYPDAAAGQDRSLRPAPRQVPGRPQAHPRHDQGEADPRLHRAGRARRRTRTHDGLAHSAARTAGGPNAPSGATGIALSNAVGLAWQPVGGGVNFYNVYRGSSATTVNTLVSPAAGVLSTSCTDTTAVNGTTYFYAVRAVGGGGAESSNSPIVRATPVPRACSTGNAIVLENCYPGTKPWDVRNAATIASGGIEGYATAASINKGTSVGRKVNSTSGAPFRVEIYRTGYYGGAGARLFSVISGLTGTAQPACTTNSTTGLIDCSNWSTSLTLTTTQDWPSGTYAIRLVREDTGTDNQILLVVRDDSRKSQVVYGVGFATFEAYNNYGGKSLYDFNSAGSTTVAGTPRAVKVSFDRPFEQPRSGLRDWYTRTEVATVYWLEQQGYDVGYVANTDIGRSPSLIQGIEAYVSPAHDEYVSAEMRNALTTARDSGTSLFFSGGNEVYWKIRFENGPNGGQSRIEVSYKSTQSGGPDPSGIPTGTWRDPNGANAPENGLTGIMYVGDNDNVYFPIVVSALAGSDRVYRYTPLASQPAGSSTTIGAGLVGWEWDARVSNGQEPPGVKTLATSPVTGELVQNNGANYNPSGSTGVNIVKYTAASGALVFSTGTNHWNRGLAPNAVGVGEPDSRIQQITTNVLADMGATPQKPSPGSVLDAGDDPNRPAAPTNVAAVTNGPDSTTVTWDPVPGADGYNVYRALAGRSDGQPLGSLSNPAVVTGTRFTDVGLSSATAYFYVVVALKAGVQSLPSGESATTTAAGAGQPTRIDVGATSPYTSSTGQVWLADTFFTGGNVRNVLTPIANTNDQKLYQTER